MIFMVAFDSEFCITTFVLQTFVFLSGFSLAQNTPFGDFFFSKELSFLRNNIDFLTNLSVDQTDLQFYIPNLVQNS